MKRPVQPHPRAAGSRTAVRLAPLLLALALLALLPGQAAAQPLPELAPVGSGVFLIGGFGSSPLELGGVLTTPLLSTSLSLVRADASESVTRVVLATGPHLTAGPLRLFGRLGVGYEWAGASGGTEGRLVARATYGAEVALREPVLLVLQGGTSMASGSAGWTPSPDATLSLGIELFFGRPRAQLRTERLRQAHRDWPPELADLVAKGLVSEDLAAARFPDWSVEELRLVSQGRVALGMTPEMVETALGRPDEMQDVQDPELGPVQVWRYYETVGAYDPFTGKPRFRRELRRTVVFRAGVVARIETGGGAR
ncbi:hypothetical protein [Limnochorda pilosa]|uniref:Uncharacterized protein n=1 Tax=Limnochorda pilosa TaxID=1555112 RepID=A0A0K2SNJ8_LIMPI|nr:hypothetical protein [Limnochorda pilosa]BAS28703.1 hypothetical protein LIP_2874 [Limnochorda pilosa]